MYKQTIFLSNQTNLHESEVEHMWVSHENALVDHVQKSKPSSLKEVLLTWFRRGASVNR